MLLVLWIKVEIFVDVSLINTPLNTEVVRWSRVLVSALSYLKTLRPDIFGQETKIPQPFFYGNKED